MIVKFALGLFFMMDVAVLVHVVLDLFLILMRDNLLVLITRISLSIGFALALIVLMIVLVIVLMIVVVVMFVTSFVTVANVSFVFFASQF